MTNSELVTLIHKLKTRAEIRRKIRKEPDRIAEDLDAAADAIIQLMKEISDLVGEL
jgi:hypothetical protein